MIDVLDSYYNYIATQMAIVGPTQTLRGYIAARDWPLTPPDLKGGLYLLYLSAVQLPKGTESQNLFEYVCQWIWITLGTDIQAGQLAENRGDRFRSDLQTAENLRQASYPGFCRKQAFSANSQGVVSSIPVISTVPLSSVESVWWSRPKFMPRADNMRSGLIYGAAAVSVFGYDDVLPVVA